MVAVLALLTPLAPHATGAIGREVRFDPAAPAELEMKISTSGQPLVRVAIDGRDAGWFLFDTGSGGHVIDPRVARRFELEVVGRVVSKNPSSEIRTRAFGARRMKLGPATFQRPVFTELDLSSLDQLTEPLTGEGLGGVIGFDVLASCVVELDYRAERLALYNPRRADDLDLPWQALVVRDDQPCVEAAFEGHHEWFLLDTGSDGGALLFSPAVERLDLLQRETRPARASNVGGTLSYRLGLLDGFVLGGRRWDATTAQLALADDGAHASILPAGLFGCVYLKAFRVVIDCSRQRAAFVEHDVPQLDRELLRAYAGWYSAPGGGAYEIRRSGDRLYTPREGGGRLWLVPQNATRFHAEDALLQFDFHLDDAGEVTHTSIRRGGRRPRMALRREPALRGRPR